MFKKLIKCQSLVQEMGDKEGNQFKTKYLGFGTRADRIDYPADMNSPRIELTNPDEPNLICDLNVLKNKFEVIEL